MKIVRFSPDHLAGLSLQHAQAYLQSLADDPGYRDSLAALGEAYTVLGNGGPVACCGVVEHHPGRAELWALLSPSSGPYMRGISKAVRGWIAQSKYQRIEAHVQAGFEAGHKWAKMLGFAPECVLQKFMPGGVDGVMYSIIKD